MKHRHEETSETFNIFHLLKNKTFKKNLLCHICELETMSTLICFTTCRKIDWQIVYQVAYNSQLFDSQFIDSHFRITPLYEIVMMFSRRFSKCLCGSANVSKLRCIIRQNSFNQQWFLSHWHISVIVLIVAILSLIYFNLFRDSWLLRKHTNIKLFFSYQI